MLSLNLQRPLVVLDIEATGLSCRSDRIVEICLVRVELDGSEKAHTFRVNPEMHIPDEVAQIHGITDDDVKDCPPFDEVAEQVMSVLDGCDVGGFNLTNFDLPLLEEEFLRARMRFSLDDRNVIDAQRIFHRMEPRDLGAAVRFFCNKDLEDAHTAEADARATLEVIKGQLEKYPDLPKDVEKLDEFCNPKKPEWVDRSGRLRWKDGEVVINFGKRSGQALRDLAVDERSYLKWIIKSDFPRKVQEIVRGALDGNFPQPPDDK